MITTSRDLLNGMAIISGITLSNFYIFPGGMK